MVHSDAPTAPPPPRSADGHGALVVLPTYDEAENLAEVLGRLFAAAPGAHALVVDDASPDGTAGLAESLARDNGWAVDVLRRPAKSGLGSAYRDGFTWGISRGFGVLCEMDADCSHDPADLPHLLAVVAAGADLAIGSRYVPGGSIPDWSLHRRLLSRWGNRYAGAMLGLGIRDATSGFRAYRAGVLGACGFERVRSDGYGFQIEMARLVHRAGGRVVEVPIAFVDRVRGTSKMSGRIILEALARVSVWGVRDRLHLHRSAPRPSPVAAGH